MAGVVARIVRLIGRGVEPLLHPDAPDRRLRERATEKRLEQLSAAAARLAEQVQRVTERIDKIDRRHAAHLERAATTLDEVIREQKAFAERLRSTSGTTSGESRNR